MSQIQQLHRRAMEMAEAAFVEKRSGDSRRAAGLFRDAFNSEVKAANLAAENNIPEPTRSVLHRSAASLGLQCGEFREAERLIEVALTGTPPSGIAKELHELRDQIRVHYTNSASIAAGKGTRPAMGWLVFRYRVLTPLAVLSRLARSPWTFELLFVIGQAAVLWAVVYTAIKFNTREYDLKSAGVLLVCTFLVGAGVMVLFFTHELLNKYGLLESAGEGPFKGKNRPRFRFALHIVLWCAVVALFVYGAWFAPQKKGHEKETIAAFDSLRTGAPDSVSLSEVRTEHLNRAIVLADTIIDKFKTAADVKQATLKRSAVPAPPITQPSDDQLKAIFEYGQLNDVAICFFIKGRATEYLQKTNEARLAYEATTNYPHARAWGSSGLFWSPAEAASIRLADMARQISMPIYLYFDADSSMNQFVPSGFMGDCGDIVINEGWTNNPHSSKTCVRIAYSAEGKGPYSCNNAEPCLWAGIYWQRPANNWGNNPAFQGMGLDLSGHTRLSFWARADQECTVEFKVGGVAGQYGDSLQPARGRRIKPTIDWRQFQIELLGTNLKHIIGGLCCVLVREENSRGAIFYVDDIRFE